MNRDIPPVYPPETIEGWYALHQIFRIDPRQADLLSNVTCDMFTSPGAEVSEAQRANGWSGAVRLIGSSSDVMFVHFRPTLDEIGTAQRMVARQPWMQALIPTYSFLSVTEAGLYYMTSQLVKAAEERGGKMGDDEYKAALQARLDTERQNPHTQRRLYPQPPAHMPYVCFYPMSKRRVPGQNWYTLSLDDRNRLMYAHGMTGRRYAGRVQQVITGAIGFEEWEWGVTLFTGDPMEFKKLVSEMRFDEASAEYAEFGPFYVGKMGELRNVVQL
jgi:chlorite dismutase